MKVRSLRARPVLVPLKRPPVSASGGIPAAALVLIDLETDGGITGRSYVFAFASWALGPVVGCLQAMGLIAPNRRTASSGVRPSRPRKNSPRVKRSWVTSAWGTGAAQSVSER